MREIKFRGKRMDNGEWVFGDYGKFHKRDGDWTHEIHCPIPKISGSYWNEVIPETVGQFTGLLDRRGKEIYEGDILKRIGDDGDEIFIIEWNEQSGGFNLNYIYFGEIYDLEELWSDSQVIGNIHDNPELMDV